MPEACRYCHRPAVVPVLDKRIEARARPGNKYRRFCLACTRWLPMCSAAHYRSHPNPHVLPIDADPSEGDVIPLADYDYTLEYAQLRTAVHATGERTDLHTTRTIWPPHPACDDLPAAAEANRLGPRVRVLIECLDELVLDSHLDDTAAFHYLTAKLLEWTESQ